MKTKSRSEVMKAAWARKRAAEANGKATLTQPIATPSYEDALKALADFRAKWPGLLELWEKMRQ